MQQRTKSKFVTPGKDSVKKQLQLKKPKASKYSFNVNDMEPILDVCAAIGSETHRLAGEGAP